MTVHVLNQPFTTRTRKSGKQYTTIDVQAEPLIINADPKALGAGPAVALRDYLRDRLLNSTVAVTAATLARRARAVKDLALGLPETVRRYSGGRIGTMQPNQSSNMFFDSGRLAHGMAVRPVDDEYVVNVPANRLNRDEFGSGFDAFLSKLAQQLHIEGLSSHLPFRKAVADSEKVLIQKQASRISELKDERAQAIAGIVTRGLLRLVG